MHELVLWVPNLHGPERARTEVEPKMGDELQEGTAKFKGSGMRWV